MNTGKAAPGPRGCVNTASWRTNAEPLRVKPDALDTNTFCWSSSAFLNTKYLIGYNFLQFKGPIVATVRHLNHKNSLNLYFPALILPNEL